MTADQQEPSARLDADLAELRREVTRLRSENARLERLLGLTGARPLPDEPAAAPLFGGTPGAVDAESAPAEKVRLFRTLFIGRDDVHAIRWENNRTGRAGWVPAVAGGWRRGGSRDFLPLTDEVIIAHLTGDLHAGTYPLLPGDGCRLLACDFDGSGALLDALAYTKAARAVCIPTGLEVSRSGVGAHVWMFFSAPVPAATARRVGAGLLREAMAIRGELDLSSYDRFFPAQDFLPASGSIGNLIALPLHGGSRRRGTTVFLDLATLEPHDDQWAYLSRIERLAPRRMRQLAEDFRPLAVGPNLRRLHLASATRTSPPAPALIRVRLGAEVSIERAGLPPALLASLKHAASLHNPEFYEREKRRLSTYGVPRIVRCYREDLDWLHLPRGLLDTVRDLVTEAGSRLDVTDDRPQPDPIEVGFHAVLSESQQQAFAALAPHDHGVLVAPPGAGKTVVACALVAEQRVPTLILVDRKPLLDQWRDQVRSLLDIKTGQLGGGRTRRTGVVDLASLQTVARRNDAADLLAGYGMVVVDECHHVPAAAFERAVRQLPARRWLGLTANPYRRDGLGDIIHMQCGPVRHEMHRDTRSATDAPLAREVFVHPTSLTIDPDLDVSVPGAIQTVYRALVTNEPRNRAIVAEVCAALDRGRHCLVLTQWTQHVETLATGLRDAGRHPIVLRGGMSAKASRAALDALIVTDESPSLLAVATGPYLGEGFDCPALDTVFLVFPIVFKGRVVQYVGRILRPYPGKTSVEVHDYVDTAVPVLVRAHAKRSAGYKALGFPDPIRA